MGLTSPFSIRADAISSQARLRPTGGGSALDSFPGTFPLGGFGAGTIGLSPDGSFSGWGFFPGVHIDQPLPVTNFSFFYKEGKKSKARVITTNPKSHPKEWTRLSEKEAKNLSFSAQYPQGVLKYEERSFSVEIPFFSPVIAHNYKETSYPVVIFPIKLKNKSSKTVELSTMFSFMNLIGYTYEKETSTLKGLDCARVNERKNTATANSVFLKGEKTKGINGEFCLSAKTTEEASVSLCTNFPLYQSEHVWHSFSETGTVRECLSLSSENKCCAVAVKAVLNPGDEIEVPIVLAWDISTPQDVCQKKYKVFFGEKGEGAFDIAKTALFHYRSWLAEINRWQDTILKEKSLPKEYKRAVFNELAMLAKSGVWDGKTGLFSYLESFDKGVYDSLDVRFYGAMSLAYLWPELEKNTINFFSKTVARESGAQVVFNKGVKVADSLKKQISHEAFPRKVKGALPHDLGSAQEHVWGKLNAYSGQDANKWKDLNSKYILQVYRAFFLSGKKDKAFLAKNFPAMEMAVEYVLQKYDRDRDFLPENEASPDQTFDHWEMRGTSAYCGGLFLAALRVMGQVAYLINKPQRAKHYRHILKFAKESFINKLWREKDDVGYFAFDEVSNVLMSGQLVGEWYLTLFRLPGVLPEDKVRKSLQTIYSFNFKNYNKGKLGLVNGRTPLGEPIKKHFQANEVWVGINYAVASHLFLLGYKKEAFSVIKVVSNITYKQGLFFRTPEGWNNNGEFNASLHMRPGAIWSMEIARNG